MAVGSTSTNPSVNGDKSRAPVEGGGGRQALDSDNTVHGIQCGIQLSIVQNLLRLSHVDMADWPHSSLAVIQTLAALWKHGVPGVSRTVQCRRTRGCQLLAWALPPSCFVLSPQTEL